MGMPALITTNGTGTSSIWFPDWMQNPFNVGIQCVVTGTATFNIEHTLDNIEIITSTNPFSGNANATTAANATWVANPGITSATTTINGNYAFPVRALRINVLSASGPGGVGTAVIAAQFVQATFGR